MGYFSKSQYRSNYFFNDFRRSSYLLFGHLIGRKTFCPSVALPKKVKQPIVCHPERSEGSLQLISRETAGMLRFAQHDSLRPACFTYLRNATLASRASSTIL
jgi:hypothetical protein